MSKTFDLSIRIRPERSGIYEALLSAAHFFTLLAGFLNGLSIEIRSLLMLLVFFSWIYCVRKYRRELCRERPIITHRPGTGWSLRLGDKPEHPVDLLGASLSTSWISILHFRSSKGDIQRILIPRDSVARDQYRHLRALLTILSGR